MDNISINVLKNNLRAYRIKNGYSQADVADQIGVSVSTFKNWERKPNKITFEKMAKLAKLYNVSVKDFFLCSDILL